VLIVKGRNEASLRSLQGVLAGKDLKRKTAVIGGDNRLHSLGIPGVRQLDTRAPEWMPANLVDDRSSDAKRTAKRALTAAGNLSEQRLRRAQQEQSRHKECTCSQLREH